MGEFRPRRKTTDFADGHGYRNFHPWRSVKSVVAFSAEYDRGQSYKKERSGGGGYVKTAKDRLFVRSALFAVQSVCPCPAVGMQDTGILTTEDIECTEVALFRFSFFRSFRNSDRSQRKRRVGRRTFCRLAEPAAEKCLAKHRRASEHNHPVVIVLVRGFSPNSLWSPALSQCPLCPTAVFGFNRRKG